MRNEPSTSLKNNIDKKSSNKSRKYIRYEMILLWLTQCRLHP